MNPGELLSSAAVNISANKMRSALTMLGIIISVCSVILIHVIGDSLNCTISSAFDGVHNANQCMIEIVPTSINKTAVKDKYGNYIIPDKLKFSEKLIERYCTRFDGCVDPIYESDEVSGIIKGESGRYVNITMTGVNSGYCNVLDEKIISGTFISEMDDEFCANTAVISDVAAEYCFGDRDPVGEYIYVQDDDGIEYQLVVRGVYEYDGVLFDTPEENARNITSNCYVCYQSFIEHYPEYTNNSGSVNFSVIGTKDFESFKAQTRDFFNEYINDDKWTADVSLITDELAGITRMMELLTKVITVITVISMIVGGIGIMNIMTVSVNERTSEIGVKKAIGASSAVIITEFLFEAALLSVISSVIGAFAGLLLSLDIVSIAQMLCGNIMTNMDIDIVFTMPYKIIGFTLLFGAVLGILFGIFPAIKAASMNIIDAIRAD